MAEAGAHVGLWAADGSASSTPLLPTDSNVRRFGGSAAAALRTFGGVDIMHDNGIWRWHHHRLAALAEELAVPRIVSTRGMLEPWAFRHKLIKKRFAWSMYQARDLKRAQCHVATSQTEARNLRSLKLSVPVTTIPNGIDVPEEGDASLSRRGRGLTRTALFLGRIYPIKGLPMLVEAWARVRPDGWLLRIAGPDEAGHQKEIERLVTAAGLGDSIMFTGPIGPDQKSAAFYDADLFVLPSHSESFGMAVAEALAHGVPVLTTTGTPWPILREKECGWWVEASADGLTQGLRQATSASTDALRAMGMRGRAYVTAELNWKHIADLMLSTYETVLTQSNCRRTNESLQPV